MMMERWPIHIDLKDDETLLSFLVRTALANGSYPHVLFQSWRNSSHTFNSDIDKTLSHSALSNLSCNTGISINNLQNSLLADLIKPLLSEEQYENSRSWRYVMHLGARNHRRSFGYGFCPECMAHEHSSYYRRHWRLLWHVGCSDHRYRLVYNCTACGTENKPHNLSFQAKSINECSHCGHALSNATRVRVHVDAFAAASWMDEYIRTDINTSQWLFTDIQEAALTLRQLMSIVRRALSKRHVRYNQAMLDWMGIDGDLSIDAKITNHEQWPVSLREATLRGAWRLLSTEPDELIAHCQSINMSQKFWLHDTQPKTTAIHHIADQLVVNAQGSNKIRISNRLIKPLPRAEVERRWQLICDQVKG